MRQNRSFSILIFFVILGVGSALAYARYRVEANLEACGIGIGAFVIALVVSSAIQVADQWDMRLGHFHSLRGPGLFFIIPVLDAIPYMIDTHVITTGFKAEIWAYRWWAMGLLYQQGYFRQVIDKNRTQQVLYPYSSPSLGGSSCGIRSDPLATMMKTHQRDLP